NNAIHLFGWADFGRTKNFFEATAREFFHARRSEIGAQQTFGCHDDERLDEIAFHLAPQDMKVLRRRREVTDLNVVFGASLQEALEAPARMLGTLTFVAVRQKQNDPAAPSPFRFFA